MKLTFTFHSTKGHKVPCDMTGGVVFFVSLLSLPVVAIISGWGFETVMTMLVGMTGVVHFVVNFFAACYRWVQLDKEDEKADDKADADQK